MTDPTASADRGHGTAGGPVVPELPDGVIAIVKRDCPTCELVGPLLQHLAHDGGLVAVASQDDPSFPLGAATVDDTSLAISFHLDVDTVPTLVRIVDGVEQERTVGWSLEHWSTFLGPSLAGSLAEGAAGLPDWRPGCGSKTYDPGMPEILAVRFGRTSLRSRRVELATAEDEIEAMYARGWTDGLPVVPPTAERVMRMLTGTSRRPDEVVTLAPPDLVECTVEKVAINAVMAGCLPEHLPIVLAAVEAACTHEFNAHGLLCTTYFAGPVLVVNGPIARDVGMNAGVNVFGQGNRANATIGRALQLVIRNVGGGIPGGIDRATFGNPGKYTFCFAELEDQAHAAGWTTLAEDRGIPAGRSAVSLFAGEGPRGIVDQRSRTGDSLARSMAACIRSIAHPKLPLGFDAILAVSPEHLRTFAAEGWSKQRTRDEILSHLVIPGRELVQDGDGIAEGIPPTMADRDVPKFRPGGLDLVHCGGDAGMFSAVIGGWANGTVGSQPITREITPWL